MTEAERPSSSNIVILPIIKSVDTRKVTTSDDERLENHRAPDKAALPGGVRSIRLKLLKIGARVTVSVRRIKVAMASAHPWKREFSIAHERLSIAAC